MSIFDQLKNMSPEKLREMKEQAQEAQQMMDKMIDKKVNELIEQKGLVNKNEVQRMIEENK